MDPRVPQKRIFTCSSRARGLIALGEAGFGQGRHALLAGLRPGVLHRVKRPLEVMDVPPHRRHDSGVEMIASDEP